MFLPLSIVIEDITYTGSIVIDFFADLSVALYDFVTGAGSSVDSLSSVTSSELTSS